MTTEHRGQGSPRLKRAPAILLLLAAAACARNPDAGHQVDLPDYESRVEVQAAEGIVVSAAALGRDESEATFGVPLNDIDVQPVWLSIDNRRDEPYWLFPLAVDPDYFPPYEVARRFGATNEVSTEQLFATLEELRMPIFLPPLSRSSGFVYARSDEGMKAFAVELHGAGNLHVFSFVVPVPGFPVQYLEVAGARGADPRRGQRDFDEPGLLAWLESLPCCAQNADGVAGDPINIVMVGSLDLVRDTLIARDWDPTLPADGASIMQMVDAFLSGERDRYAPISALYVMGQEHDLAFQKARDTIGERNHMRLWKTPVRFQGQDVWLGQISRDVGVKLTWKLWPPTTHVIDPDVDEARFHLLQDLLEHRAVSRLGFVYGQAPASPDLPYLNAEADPYFTDGLRAIFILSEGPVEVRDVGFLPWRLPPEMEPYRDIYASRH